jgi:signal transduction histidine kinase
LKRRPAPAVETALYRVVQEALTNVVRHSRAKNAAVQLDSDGEGNVRCAVTDDGVGFDVAATISDARARGLGLLGIRERVDAMGGSLRITSRPASGTVLSVEFPAEA